MCWCGYLNTSYYERIETEAERIWVIKDVGQRRRQSGTVLGVLAVGELRFNVLMCPLRLIKGWEGDQGKHSVGQDRGGEEFLSS